MLSERWREAPLRPELAAALRFLEVLSLRPPELRPRQVRAARAAGVPLGGLEHASMVCSSFTIMNRMVDAFGADIPRRTLAHTGAVLDLAGKAMGGLGRVRVREPYAGRRPKPIASLLTAIRQGPGDAPAALRYTIEARIAASTGAERPAAGELPPEVRRYVDKVGQDARLVQDQDVADLKSAGWSEEAIYEMTFVAAAAAAIGRQERAWEVLSRAGA